MGMVKMKTGNASLGNLAKYIHPQEPEVNQEIFSFDESFEVPMPLPRKVCVETSRTRTRREK